jgi:aminopeptidase N
MVSTNTTAIEDPAYEKTGDGITKEIAEFRSGIVSNCSYDVTLALGPGDEYYGIVVASFELSALPKQPLYLDFKGLKIANLTINTKESMDLSVFLDHKIQLDPSLLEIGQNEVSMDILNKYRKDGVGLHSFIDQTDGNQYLYSQYAAAYCHYVMPCFDQPDLKAPWTFRARVPEAWTVVSNDVEIEDAEKELLTLDQSLFGIGESNQEWRASSKVFVFKQTPRISTYLFAIVAGPYGHHESKSEGFPDMKIYARKNLIDKV